MKISIITPVYKAEKFLPLYFKAIKAQTFRDFEIIFIDGDSPDNAGIMVENFKKQCEIENQDFKVQVYHKANEGAASSRNAGLSLVRGEYVVFIDGDDWPDPDFLNILYKTIEFGVSDLGVVGYRFGFKRKLHRHFVHKIKEIKSEKLECSVGNYLSFLCKNIPITNFAMPFFVWNKIYKTKLIRDTGANFSSIDYPEDIYFNFRYLGKCNKISFINEKLYNFFYNSESLSKNSNSLVSNANKQILCASNYLNSTTLREYDRTIYDSFMTCSVFVQFFQMRTKDLKSKEMQPVWKYLNKHFQSLKNNKYNLRHFKIFYYLFALYKFFLKPKC